MKIVNSAAAVAQGSQKSGVVGAASPFKKVMSGAKGNTPKPQGTSPLVKSAMLTAPPVLKKQLPGGVAPLQGRKTLARVDVARQQVTAAGTTRQTARADANAKAENLVDLRAQGQQQVAKRYDTRLVDLICQELKSELGGELRASNSDRQQQPIQAAQPPSHNHDVTPLTQAAATMKDEAKVKAASAVELIEKIEAFVKSQRPGLALTLDSSLGVRVEIERLGPKEVALRVVGANGPPAPEDIGRIREEMRARGLKVGALSVA